MQDPTLNALNESCFALYMYRGSTDETTRVYFAKEIRNWNCKGWGNYLKKSSTWMISRVCFSLLIHMPCQLVNTAVRSVLPFDPDASDLPVAWGLGFGFVWNQPHESKLQNQPRHTFSILFVAKAKPVTLKSSANLVGQSLCGGGSGLQVLGEADAEVY